MKNYLLLLPLFAFLMACQPEVDPVKLEKVDALQLRIDSSMQSFEVIDSTKALSSAQHYADNIAYIKSEYQDTISREIARFFDEYYSIRKAMKLIRESYAEANRELKTTKSRLENLEHDLNNHLMEEEQFTQYIQLEQNNVALIEEKVNDVQYAYETVQPMYDSMNPKVDSLISAYKLKVASAKE